MKKSITGIFVSTVNLVEVKFKLNFFTKLTVLTKEDSDHIFCKFLGNICLHSEIINISTMHNFQSEQVIKL